MRKATQGLIFAVFVISMFLLSPMNQVVSAETVPVTKIVDIEADSAIDYAATLNIINNSNVKYTNEELLISAFEDKTGVTGMISGSFMPPAKFQLGDNILGVGSWVNDNLVLASTVQFQKKNLLSGASSSWWRCPYYYDSSVASSKDFSVRLSIYHTDLPRTTNLTTTTADLYNTVNNKIPQAMAHPSLVYQQTYLNCGNTNTTNQTFIEVSNTMPVNDTLVNPDKPLNLTADHSNPDPDYWDPAYNPYKYETTINYAHAWFNVSAPIYPNSTYFVVWDIKDLTVGGPNAGSCWVTATDIGNDEYGRMLMAWNGITYNGIDVWEIPIDLDISVVFQTGLGAGVSGTELRYNQVTVENQVSYGHTPTTTFTGTSFEETAWNVYDNMATMSYTTIPIAGGSINQVTTGTSGYINFVFDKTGTILDGFGGIDGRNSWVYEEMYYPIPTFGKYNMNFDVSLYEIPVTDPGVSVSYGCQFKIALHSNTRDVINVIFQRYHTLFLPSTIVYSNAIYYETTLGGWTRIALPDYMPQDLFVNILTDYTLQSSVITLYDQNVPNEIYFASVLVGTYNGIHPGDINMVSFSACVPSDSGIPNTDNPNQVAVTFRKWAGVNRLLISAWNTDLVTDTWESRSRLADGFETQVPNAYYNSYPDDYNWQAMQFTQTSASENYGYIYQDTIDAPDVPDARRVYFAEAYFRVIESIPNGGTSFRLVLWGIDTIYGTPAAYVQTYYYLSDGAWHKASSGQLTGRFNKFQLSIAFNFPAASGIRHGFVDDIKVYSIEQPKTFQFFRQELDKTGWNATNYYTFMIPFRQTGASTMAPYVYLDFVNSGSASLYNVYSMPTDFNDDFIIISIPTVLITYWTVWVDIYLFIFDPGMYLFLQDRNQDFTVNTVTDMKYNTFEEFNQPIGTYWTPLTKTLFSPYYSLKTTAGQWLNADSAFTTTYFYYVVTRYIRFNDNDPEVISISIDTVDVQDIEAYRLKLKTFGPVYDAKEWVSYLEYMNRPSLWDKIVDAFANLAKWLLENTWLGQILLAIGKFIYDAIVFLVPLLESLGAYILEAVVFIAAVVIFIISTWVMWNFVRFWILVGQNRVEEGLEVLGNMSAKVQAGIQSVASGITSVVKKAGTGGLG
jgi:hypothetical protein